jgi:hypothetical protein
VSEQSNPELCIGYDDLVPAVDRLMANGYAGDGYSREIIHAALWDWLEELVEDIVKDAHDYSHGPYYRRIGNWSKSLSWVQRQQERAEREARESAERRERWARMEAGR